MDKNTKEQVTELIRRSSISQLKQVMEQAGYREVREFIPQQVPLSQLLNNYNKQTVDDWVQGVIELCKFEYLGLFYSSELMNTIRPFSFDILNL